MIGDRLCAVRAGADLSLREFAGRLCDAGYSVSHSAVRAYERRDSVPSAYLLAVARAFGADPLWLLGASENGARRAAAGSPTSDGAGASSRDGRLRLLLVEDNPGDARLVEAHLVEADLDADLRHCTDLGEARSALAGARPDLCFLDLDLPGISGLETVARFRELAGDLPLVVLTGQSDPEVGAGTIRAGADDFLVKDELTAPLLARTVRHVLERDRSLRQRRAMEERWAKLFAASPVANVLSEAATGRMIEVNDAFVEMFGHEREEVLGESSLELGYWEDPQRRRELTEEVLAEGYIEGEEAWFRDADGRRGRMLLACRRLELSGEDHLLWTVQDVTDRVRRERALGERVKEQACLYDVSRILRDEARPLEVRLQGVVDRIPEGWQYPEVTVARLHVDGETYLAGEFHRAGPRLDTTVQVEGEAVGELSVGYREEPPPEEGGPFLAEERELLEEIAGQLSMELSRQKTRREMTHVVETMGEAVTIVAPDGTITFANSAARRLFGGESEEYVGREMAEFADRVETLEGTPFPPGERPFQRVMRTGEPVRGLEHVLEPPGGERVVVSVNAAPIRGGTGGVTGVVLTVRDVTDRHRADRWRNLLESAVESAAHGVLITDRDGTIVWANPEVAEMTGYGREELIGENPRILRSGRQDDAFYRELWTTILGGETWRGEIVNRRKDGTLYTERQSVVPVRHRGDEISHFVAIKEDISEERARQERLEETTERLHGLLEASAGIIFRARLPDLGFTHVTPNVGDLTGHSAGRWTEDPDFWKGLVPEGDRDRTLHGIREALESGEDELEQEFRLRHANGDLRWFRAILRFEADASGEPAAVVGTAVDVTQRRELEDQLRYQALHDPLTDLANRSLLSDRLGQALARARRHEEGIAVVMLDLNRFKQINESLGHTAGDRVLVEVARRLENAVRAEDTVARWGGDEFLLLLTGLEARGDLERIRDRLLDQLRQTVPVMGRELNLHVSLGAVLVGLPDDPHSVPAAHPDDLVRYADLALRRVKEDREGPFRLYRPDADGSVSSDPLAREQDLRRGLEKGEFEPFYQPVVDLASGRIWGLEPLARWRHPERGVLSPGEFIGLAEETGYIGELGRQIMIRSFGDLAGWCGRGELRLSLNVSGRQFDDAGLVSTVAAALEEASLPPELVQVEVTETSIMRATQRITDLRDLGVGVVIDDFGTGYSSLLYLRDLPVDGLKIDMSFVQGLGKGKGNSAIVETVLTLGRTMDLQVIAEGIETEDQRRRLRGMGCRLGQGYLFARPMSSPEMERFLDEHGDR